MIRLGAPAVLHDPVRRLGTLAVILVIALASVVSAARMAPAAPTPPALAAFVAAGGDAGAVCGGTPADPDYHCPFCHLLADPPPLRFAPRGTRLSPCPAWRPARDLDLAPSGRNPDLSPRGPPGRA